MQKISCIVLTLGLAACAEGGSQKPTNQLAFNDFENVEGWSGDAPVPSLTQEQAHSGTRAVRVAEGLDYSLGYRNTLGRMGRKPPQKIKVEGWVYAAAAQPASVLVTQLRNPTTNQDILWKGLNLADLVKTKHSWVRVEQTVALPATATPESQLLVYLWRNGSPQPTYLDDLRITSVD